MAAPGPGPPAASAARPAAAARPPAHRVRSLALMFGVTVLIVTADAISKALVLAKLPGHPPVRLLGGLITLTLTFNAGAAFSVGTSYTVVITLIVCAVIVTIIRTARRLRSVAWTIALGLLLGGAAGNLGDRLFRAPGPMRGRVVDWINLPHFPWTFNLADSAVTCAAVLIAVLTLHGIPIEGTPTARPPAELGRPPGSAGYRLICTTATISHSLRCPVWAACAPGPPIGPRHEAHSARGRRR